MTTNIQSAVAEIKVYANRELQLLDQKAQKQIELEIAERRGGDALLDGDNNDSIERVVRLQVELRQIDLAIISCRARRLAAIEAKHSIEIANYRERASAAREQADAIGAKSQSPLDTLRALEGCAFMPNGTPESSRLRALANSLESMASQQEGAGIARHGNVHLTGPVEADEVVLAVLEFAADGPSAQQIRDWFAGHDQHAQFASHRLHVYLVWSAGQIDGATSRIQVLESLTPPAAAPPVPEAPADTGRLISPNQFFGYEPKPRRIAREE